MTLNYILQKAMNYATTTDQKEKIEKTIVCSDYAEPGYSCDKKIVVLADWNDVRDLVNDKGNIKDDTMSRLYDILEMEGYGCEWEDEWVECAECYEVIRITGDCYGWTPFYWQSDDGFFCGNCVRETYKEEYLSFLKGNIGHANVLLDLDGCGYEQINGQFENGFYEGQADDPEKIVEVLHLFGIKDYIFQIDSVGQFDTNFSIYCPKGTIINTGRSTAEGKVMKDILNKIETTDIKQHPSPAERCRQALRGDLK
jgi:hypothetical protein